MRSYAHNLHYGVRPAFSAGVRLPSLAAQAAQLPVRPHFSFFIVCKSPQ
jgi:hypothetical protein